ncbi:efflux RND transporter periplasmic adaptor subunit [Terrihabitans rhizophilus]|uniref:Efflux RND transporter periplasmic adaptor subunit n=1 Tax=Terrihabitans rhizophilus TaxID=3092662 RepID=A0ABU4RKJ1_9HYPH|nr:efflux RND transporter periplasmic adaptor subunit [Terrihabitans sp. PJ23]MDX6804579.1 efflux RND transporter periplasmic adaptor subunit [Terrihabitans sp. PJ23]
MLDQPQAPNDLAAPPSSPASAPARPVRRRRRRWPIFLLLLIACAGVGGYFYWQDGAPKAEPATVEVTRGTVTDSVAALGNLQPLEYVDLGAQVSGQVKKIPVVVGDEVKSGDLLAEIDPVVLNTKVLAGRASLAALKAQLADKEAQRDLANQSLERQKRLLTTRAVSESAFESAEAGSRSAAAQVDMLKAQIQQTEATLRGDEATLGYTKILAPMDGTVVSVDARQGQTLNATQQAPVLMRVADLSTMTVWTQVSEADISRLTIGMLAQFTTLGSGERRWEGRLRQVLPTPEVTNNVVLYTALFDVENPKRELMTQMTAQVFFVVAEAKDVLTVPLSALRERGRPGSGRYTARVAAGSGVEERPVEIGVKNRVTAEIRSGLSEGDKVLVNDGAAGGASGGQRRTGGPRTPGLRL